MASLGDAADGLALPARYARAEPGLELGACAYWTLARTPDAADCPKYLFRGDLRVGHRQDLGEQTQHEPRNTSWAGH